jgi:hypothetical protein
MKASSEELADKLTLAESQVLQLGQDMKVKNAIEESLNKQIMTLEKQVTLNLDQLPERQVEIVRAEEERLKRWEGRLGDLEAKLGMREAVLVERSARNSELLKVEANEEKVKAMAEVEAAKKALNNAVAEFEEDRVALRQTISRSEADMDAKARVMSAERMAFEAMLKKFKEEKLRFEIERKSFEPSMKALEEKKTAVEEAQRRIEEKAREVEAHSGEVRREGMLLEEKEKDLSLREESNLVKDRGLQSKERELERRGVMLQKQLTNLQDARFGVHEQQLAVAKEVAEVKRALLALKVLEGRVGGREALTLRRHTENGGGGVTLEGLRKGGNLNSIETLERAIGRCSSSLDELTLRSRAAIVDIVVPVERVNEVATGPPTPTKTPFQGVMGAKSRTPLAGKVVDAMTKTTTTVPSVRQLLGTREMGTSLGQQASFAAQRMKQAAIASSTTSRVRW